MVWAILEIFLCLHEIVLVELGVDLRILVVLVVNGRVYFSYLLSLEVVLLKGVSWCNYLTNFELKGVWRGFL